MNGAAAAALAAALLLGGCAAQQTTHALYHWGSYEDLIYASYSGAGNMPPERQIEALELDLQKARAANQRLPPGWHAHLGYLYYELGKMDQARQELQLEKAEFPESMVFTDRLLTNLAKP